MIAKKTQHYIINSYFNNNYFTYRVSEGFMSLSLDRKCSDGGCWYCKGLCHNCMKPAVYGYTKVNTGSVYKHCSEHCKMLHFGNPPEVQADLVYLNSKVNKSLSDVVLLQITEVMSAENNANNILSIQLCLSCNRSEIPDDVPYVLVQIRTLTKSIFMSSLLLPDMSLGEPLYKDCAYTFDNIQILSFLQKTLQFAVVKNGISDLDSLLTKYRSFLHQ